jgi:hypothetical protein
MTTATREDILKLTTQREHLLASGLQDSDFKDGSLAMGRVFCCHPSLEEGMAIWFYVPPDAPVQVGDIVVVRMGHEATKKDSSSKVNTLVEVRRRKTHPIRTVHGIHQRTFCGGGSSTPTGCQRKVGR